MSMRKLCATVAVPIVLAGAIGATAATLSGPPEGKVDKVAAFGLLAPETNNWDKGGHDAFTNAAKVLGAKPTWLSNITFDQSPQVIDRLARSGNKIIISNGSGFGDAMLDAAAKYPDTWFWVYSDLATTKGLPNVVGLKLYWNQAAYIAGAIACMASKTKKIGFVIASPIPAYSHAAAGVVDGVKKYCGSTKSLIYTWTGTFDDVAKVKQATQTIIDKGADVVTDFQDAATPGVIAAVKANPRVRYIGTMFDWTKAIPKQIIASVYFNYDSGYVGAAKLFASGKLKPEIYPSNVTTGGIKVTKITNAPGIATKVSALVNGLKTGAIKVNITRQLKK
jgi:basic membrane protein A